MAARKHSGVDSLPDSWRDKIQATQIFNRLIECFEGKVNLSAQQVKVADIILKKIVPDLQRSEITGKDGKDIAAFIYEARNRAGH